MMQRQRRKFLEVTRTDVIALVVVIIVALLVVMILPGGPRPATKTSPRE